MDPKPSTEQYCLLLENQTSTVLRAQTHRELGAVLEDHEKHTRVPRTVSQKAEMDSALSNGISILRDGRVGRGGGERASLEAASGIELGTGIRVAILSTRCQDPLLLKGFSVGK